MKPRIARAEKKTDEWSRSEDASTRATTAPAKPHIDDEELQVASHVNAASDALCAHCLQRLRDLRQSMCVCFLRFFAVAVVAFFMFFSRSSIGCFSNCHIVAIVAHTVVVVSFIFRRDLVANLGGGAGSAARRPQLQ